MSMRAQTEPAHQTNRITELLLSFYQCSIVGWCLEVMFISVGFTMADDRRLMGRTSLIMLPIYGMGVSLFPISRLIDNWLAGLPGFEDARADRISRLARAVRHGLIYMALTFIAEYITGIWLTSLGICPWDCSLWPDNVGGIIRLKLAPLWLGTGLLFEYPTRKKSGY